MKTKEILGLILSGGHLEDAEMEALFGDMMDGKLSDSVIAALLVAMRARGETSRETTAAARVMRDRVCKVPLSRPDEAVDTCGTGGDGADTINISTAAACVVAAAGVPVAKHGNRSVSSRCGSADVLEAMGVALELDATELARLCEETGLSFLFAPRLHPAMRSVMPVRRELGIRTVFNILGPLTNPAGVTRQLIGTWDTRAQDLLAETAEELGVIHVLVVHSEDGLDELSVFAPTRVLEVRKGRPTAQWTCRPEKLGISTERPESLDGGDVEYNVRRMREVLSGGESSAASESISLNAAAALMVAGRVGDLAEGLEISRNVLKSGAALDKLRQLASATRRPGHDT